MAKDEVIRRAWEVIEPHLVEQGYELVEIEFGQHGADWILRLFVDREGGITIDDCAAVSQLMDPILDADDFIGGSYMLEVSSPGIDRPVRKAADFARFVGEKVKVQTATPLEGRKRFKGVLTRFEDGLLTVDCDGSEYEIHIENVLKARLDR